jgi:hypothetical protein
MAHVLDVHVAPPFEPPGHTFPHVPQFVTELVVSTHPASSQFVRAPQTEPLSALESSVEEPSSEFCDPSLSDEPSIRVVPPSGPPQVRRSSHVRDDVPEQPADSAYAARPRPMTMAKRGRI